MRLCIALAFLLAVCSGKTQNARPIWDEFSGENALKHVQALVDCGPRPPGTPEIECARKYMTGQLENFGWKVTKQEFSDETPRGKMNFVNLIATFPSNVKTAPKFLLCSHYDT